MALDERQKQLLTLGREAYANREFDKAEGHLTQFLRENRGFADVCNMLGVIHHEQGRYAPAQQMFEEALRLNPGYTEAALNLAVTYNELGKYQEAREIYSRAMAKSKAEPRSLDPFARGKLANMHADLGSAYYDVGFYAEAVTEYRKALELCPTFVDIRTRLANTLRDQGKLEEAVVEFEMVRETNPSYLPARIHLGVTFYSLGRLEEAVAEWNEVLKLDPQSKSARVYLQLVASKKP
ncbi:MAG TPA: tetratricopeptide repeat protein [Polyangia bacterium]|jgi:tetratricopeptide (TPR) repeat protein